MFKHIKYQPIKIRVRSPYLLRNSQVAPRQRDKSEAGHIAAFTARCSYSCKHYWSLYYFIVLVQLLLSLKAFKSPKCCYLSRLLVLFGERINSTNDR